MNVVIAGLTAFVVSFVWYSPLMFGDLCVKLRGAVQDATPVWAVLVEPIRELIVAYVLARLLTHLEIVDWKRAARLGFGLWLAFHAVSMAGAVIWENMLWMLGAVHAGDWLMKMLLMAVVLSVWRRRAQVSL